MVLHNIHDDINNLSNIENNSNYRYVAFGLEIESQIKIPEFRISYKQDTPQLSIHFGKVPKELNNVVFSGVRFQVSRNQFLLNVDQIATYFITDGNRIIIEPYTKAREEDIRIFLLGSAFGAIFHQRGNFPIHGSAIILENKAYIFSGISGVGKSTLAASFQKRGYPIITDDICMITLSEKGIPLIFPSYPQIKLWSDTIDKMGFEKSSLKKVRDGLLKYAIPIGDNYFSQPFELAGMYIITTKNSQGIHLEKIKGLEKFNLVKNSTYRLQFLKGMDITSSFFKHIDAISRSCFLIKVERPTKGFYLNELSDIIEKNLLESIK